MNTLTGNEDVDVKIINTLDLHDLRHICQINLYVSNLCENHIDLKFKIKNVKNKVNHIISLINDKPFGIIIQPNNGNQNFKSFHDLMDNVNIKRERIDYMDDVTLSVLDNYIVQYIKIFFVSGNYRFSYYISRKGNLQAKHAASFSGSKSIKRIFTSYIL